MMYGYPFENEQAEDDRTRLNGPHDRQQAGWLKIASSTLSISNYTSRRLRDTKRLKRFGFFHELLSAVFQHSLVVAHY